MFIPSLICVSKERAIASYAECIEIILLPQWSLKGFLVAAFHFLWCERQSVGYDTNQVFHSYLWFPEVAVEKTPNHILFASDCYFGGQTCSLVVSNFNGQNRRMRSEQMIRHGQCCLECDVMMTCGLKSALENIYAVWNKNKVKTQHQPHFGGVLFGHTGKLLVWIDKDDLAHFKFSLPLSQHHT